MRGKICVATWALLLSLLVTAVSGENALVFTPEATGILFAADGSTPMDHLFGCYLAISPGETLEETVCIRPTEETRLVLQCLDASPELSGIRLTVRGARLIYDGPLTGLVDLGRFSPEQMGAVHLSLTIPEELSPQGRQDWLKLRWSLGVPDSQSPRTGDNVRLPAAVFAGALTGLALALPWGRRFRKTQKSGKV